MTTDQNKTIVSEFFSRFSANDVTGALNALTTDVSWWISGKPEHLPAAGVYDKEEIAGLLYRMSDQLVSGLKMKVKGLIAEGDKVAVEVESYGELQNGRIYNNQYHMLMTIRDGKICEVKEYLDTQHVFATWFQPQ